MTAALRPAVPSMQVLGLIGSIVATPLSLLFGERYVSVDTPAAIIAVVTDLIAIRATSNATASIAFTLKVVAVVVTMGFLISGGPGVVNPVVAPRTGAYILMLSLLPSGLGVLGRWFGRGR